MIRRFKGDKIILPALLCTSLLSGILQAASLARLREVTQEEVEKIGWRWGDEKQEDLQKAFKIIPQEERLLKKIQVPLPKEHHDLRFRKRVKYRKIN